MITKMSRSRNDEASSAKQAVEETCAKEQGNKAHSPVQGAVIVDRPVSKEDIGTLKNGPGKRKIDQAKRHAS